MAILSPSACRLADNKGNFDISAGAWDKNSAAHRFPNDSANHGSTHCYDHRLWLSPPFRHAISFPLGKSKRSVLSLEFGSMALSRYFLSVAYSFALIGAETLPRRQMLPNLLWEHAGPRRVLCEWAVLGLRRQCQRTQRAVRLAMSLQCYGKAHAVPRSLR